MITVHAPRSGTGQSTFIANLAVLLARQGYRVGIIDANLQAMSIHLFFHLSAHSIRYTFNDYLLGLCQGPEAAYDVTDALKTPLAGRIFLVPASTNSAALDKVLHEGYSIELVTDGLRELGRQLHIDMLLVDTHAGLNEQTLLAMLSIAVSDTLITMLRLDQGDYQGTGVTLDVARTLEVPHVVLVVSQVAAMFDLAAVRQQVAETYQCDVVAALPYAHEFVVLDKHDMFVLRYPEHVITSELQRIAATISGVTKEG
jgi:MinD-like ATPase involved in chromosome partitioning or flagellar assembly